MQLLLQTVSHQFISLFKKKWNLCNLFELSSTEAQYQVQVNATFLKSWIQQFIDKKNELNDSDAGPRWEFDQNVLFNEIEHFAKIFQKLTNVFQIIIEFENLFGDQLKSWINVPYEVDYMTSELNNLKTYFPSLSYDIFRMGNVEYWDESLQRFNDKVHSFELETELFLDRCVGLLRTPVDGIALMTEIGKMRTRKCFEDHISTKSDDVVKVLISHIGNVEHEFLKNCKNPPISRNQSKSIGAIIWARSLFDHLKETVTIFKQVSSWM